MTDCLWKSTPEAGSKDFIENVKPNGLKLLNVFLEPSMVAATADDKFQFERPRYLIVDRVGHVAGKVVFNLAMGFKDSWGK